MEPRAVRQTSLGPAMRVPNHVIFGPDLKGQGSVNYGFVRGVEDPNFRIQLLKARLDSWLVKQTDVCEKNQTSDGQSSANAPFPLAILTCVAIETLAQVIHGDSQSATKEGAAFKNVLGKLHQKLSRPLKKCQREQLNDRGFEKCKTIPDVIYTYFRNTLQHGFQGQGVYLTDDETNEFSVDEAGILLLNPYWFWSKFKLEYHDQFQSMLSTTDSRERFHCLAYIEKLLK